MGFYTKLKDLALQDKSVEHSPGKASGLRLACPKKTLRLEGCSGRQGRTFEFRVWGVVFSTCLYPTCCRWPHHGG